jgi:hypothetical protein
MSPDGRMPQQSITWRTHWRSEKWRRASDSLSEAFVVSAAITDATPGLVR